jgi:hypothetical protein
MNQAQRIISKCGGAQAVAEITGVHPSRVHRWGYPKEKGGSDGVIPARHHQKLLEGARKRGIKLRPADFFEVAQ